MVLERFNLTGWVQKRHLNRKIKVLFYMFKSTKMNNKLYIQNLFINKNIIDSLGFVSDNLYQNIYALVKQYSKDVRRLFKDLLFWITRTQSVSLLQIAHVSSKKLWWWKAKNIVSSFSKFLENTKKITNVSNKYLHKITKWMWKDGIVNVIVDGWDILKPYSLSKETTTVRDGSSWEYWTWYCVDTLVWFTNEWVTIPLVWRVFNRQELTDVQSYMWLIQRLDEVSSSNVKCRYIFDRRYDDKKLFKLIQNMWNTFLVALKSNRQVQTDWERIAIKDIGKRIKFKNWTIESKTRKKKISWRVWFTSVHIRGLDDTFYLVVCKNRKWIQLCLLTNEPIETHEQAKQQVMLYGQRRLIEENYKYMKQVYNLEKVNIRNLKRINNIYNLLLITIGMSMRCMRKLWKYVKEIISLNRSNYFVGYQVKNLLYERIEVLVCYQNQFGVLQNFRGRHPSSKLLNQLFLLPQSDEG